ncbi:hypothetical protein TNIN_136001 [Trichonephila inaurata madagascariensis]|uniref:Uncharacterized protein n=1 Tax=Trichonephila inaurata madagascariensis TaxID=2747483 RepID=A0A8X6XE81_9ARAC|nr:hypothetical protein TNIN_136001 [Trichonephila inaurata madagascariensis]
MIKYLGTSTQSRTIHKKLPLNLISKVWRKKTQPKISIIHLKNKERNIRKISQKFHFKINIGCRDRVRSSKIRMRMNQDPRHVCGKKFHQHGIGTVSAYFCDTSEIFFLERRHGRLHHLMARNHQVLQQNSGFLHFKRLRTFSGIGLKKKRIV